MLIRRLIPVVLGVTLLAVSPALAQRQQSVQTNPERERAKAPYDEGMAHLRAEAFDKAAKAFQLAGEIDPTFDMAFYMLGRTHMATKSYASAIVALTRCRDLHVSAGSKQFANKQEAERYRRDRIAEINDLISSISQVPNLTFAQREQIRQLEERKRQIEDADRNLSIEKLVPAYVSLSLGSAYFRSGKMPEAEAAYRATVGTDPKIGEAHNNLAVVYMETGRFDEAERSVKAAEKAGLKVNPALKEEIKKRKAASKTNQ